MKHLAQLPLSLQGSPTLIQTGTTPSFPTTHTQTYNAAHVRVPSVLSATSSFLKQLLLRRISIFFFFFFFYFASSACIGCPPSQRPSLCLTLNPLCCRVCVPSILKHPLLPPPPLCFLIFQNADDLLVASAECPSDDEDLEECEPGNGESTLGVLSPFI